jgi:hypothetical protein
MSNPENMIDQRLRRWLPLLTIFLTAIIFDRLFHLMDLGINVLLFTMVVIGVLLMRLGWSGLSLPARAALGGALLSAVMVVVHNSILSMVVAVMGLVLGSALAHEPRLRSLYYALQQAVANAIMLPASAWDGVGELVHAERAPRKGWSMGRIMVLPLIIGVVFFQIYRVGNPRFEAMTAGFLDGIWSFVADLLSSIFTPHALFFLFAMFVAGLLLFRHAPATVVQWEQRWTDFLLRKRIRRPHWMAPTGMNLLERERRMGLVLLVLVNVLLAVVNAIDVSWVWFGFEVPQDFSLKQFVHEGTWALIISILLSMVILLHLFRGNQNFYQKGDTLKRLALLWVCQNFILGISVFLRNYHYISFHGLAYKRIGVIVFLALVMVGLITLYFKVKERKSFFYLVRLNTWALFMALVSLSMVDWDTVIVRYNLKHDNPGEIDIDNYLAMSDKVLPLLYENIEVVEMQMARHRNNRVRWVETLEPRSFRISLDVKRDRFLQRSNKAHWQEWNLADARTMRYFLPEKPRS